MGKKSRSGSGMNHPGSDFRELSVKTLKLFDADADPWIRNLYDAGSGMENIRIRDKHPGSATLVTTYNSSRDSHAVHYI
jgi:hypothetical protein